MIVSCINCGYTDVVDLRVGAVTSDRHGRRMQGRERVPDVFICTICMEATKNEEI